MSAMLKKAWSKPELIVLVRGKPEETVLANCKGGGTTVDTSFVAGGCKQNGCIADRSTVVAS